MVDVSISVGCVRVVERSYCGKIAICSRGVMFPKVIELGC